MTSTRPDPDIEGSIWIARPPKDIWNFIFDTSNDTQWRDRVTDARWTSDPPHGVGSTGVHVIEGMGDWTWETTALVEPRIMSWRYTAGRFEGSHGAYRIEPEGDGSRFIMDNHFKRSIIMTLLMLVMKGRTKRQFAADLERLKAILEA
jgi:hypothetical protein